MKKIAVLLLMCMFIFSACGEVIDGIDKNKTQIYVSVYNGGYGINWIQKIADDWNAQNDKYQIIIKGDKKDSTATKNEVELKSDSATAYSIFFNVSSDYQTLIQNNKLLNLEEMLDWKIDGEDGGTLREKLDWGDDGYFDDWKKMSSIKGQGLYMLPWSASMSGLVYDHDLFLEKGWLQYADISEINNVKSDGIDCRVEGNYLLANIATRYYRQNSKILTKGKDGKYGTYDDGQPENITQWQVMLEKIVDRDNARAFLWTGQFAENYTSSLAYSLMAQYQGIDAVKAYCTYDSKGLEYAMHGTEPASFDINNGYKAYGMECVYQAVRFYEQYLNKNENKHPSCSYTSVAHTDAQALFLLGYKNEPTNPQAAMLLESTWWENEARPAFNDMEDANRKYGKRDYRYMLLPDLDGQQGAFGNGKGTAFSASELSSVFVVKSNNNDKNAMAMDFLAYTLKDKYLRAYTVETGTVRPYKYSLSETDRAQMTYFANCAYDIYNDKDNICLVRPTLYYNGEPINFATNKSTNMMNSKINGVNYPYLIYALKSFNSETVFNGIKNNYSLNEWAGFLQTAKEQGFYLI